MLSDPYKIKIKIPIHIKIDDQYDNVTVRFKTKCD